MTKNQYYETIKEYNQLLDKQSSGRENFTKEDEEHLESVRKSLLDKVKYLDYIVIVGSCKIKTEPEKRKALDKLRKLEKCLTESKNLNKNHYEDSWIEDLWFGFLTNKKMIAIILVCLILSILKYLSLF